MSDETFEDLFVKLERNAAYRQTVVYNIHFCNAGVGIEYHEAFRVTTPTPPEKEEEGGARALDERRQRLQHHLAVSRAQAEEGRVTYEYYETIRQAVEAELFEFLNFDKPSKPYESRVDKWNEFQARGN